MRNGRDRLIAQGRRPLVFDNRRSNLLDGKRTGPGPTRSRFQAVIEQARKAEILQPIDLFRVIDTTKRKTVNILCSTPIDRLVEGRGPPSADALAAVLKAAVKDIQVREHAGSEPLAKASTAPDLQ